MEKYNKDKNIYTCIENQFKKTGIGFRAIYNKHSDSYHKWDFDTTKLENINLLPPYNNSDNFTLIVPPREERIVLGLRVKTFGSFWNNLQSKYSIQNGYVPSEAKEENITDDSIKHLAMTTFPKENLKDYYDYTTTSLDEIKQSIKFETVAIAKTEKKIETITEKLLNEHPVQMKLVLELTPFSNENTLIWAKSTFDNGSYVGQVNKDNQRHGRGVFLWNEGTYYVGYWENGLRNKKGKYCYSNNKVFYDGEFLNGVKNGKGIQFYNDGSKFSGDFFNEKRHGKGTYTWADGSSWTGPFVFGNLHGVGMFYPGGSEEPYEAEYEHGKQKF